MKRTLVILLSPLLAFCFTTLSLNGSPFYGAELTYTYQGGNDYLIRLTYYRYCEAIWAPQSVIISFACSDNATYNFNATLLRTPASGEEITNVCSYQSTHCSNGTLFGIEKYIYQATVQLVPCSNWTMTYEGCCRNPSNTIQNPTSQSLRVIAKLHNVTPLTNHSPIFANDAIVMMCVGQTTCYNHGVYDLDGDSLAYSLITPLGYGATTVSYAPPYSATQPLLSVPPVSMDPVTGDICMTPTIPIVSLMAIKVEEWRCINGIMTQIGFVIRDIQFHVVSCTNKLPTLSGMDLSLSPAFNPNDTLHYSEVCLGETIDFTIKGHDEDTFNQSNSGSPEIFRIFWNHGIPGGTFSTYNNDTDSAYARFTWTPSFNDLTNQSHCFSATVQDSACPNNGIQSFAYCVRVRHADSISISGPDTICLNHIATLIADSGFTSYLWSNGDTGQIIQLNGAILGQGPFSFLVTASNGYCESVTGHSLFVNPCTGISSRGEVLNFHIFPNPSSDRVHFEIEGYQGECLIELFDLQGRHLLCTPVNVQDGYYRGQFSIGNTSQGLYVIRLTNNSEIQQRRLQVQ